jgi:CheY-like chemotaxis protein
MLSVSDTGHGMSAETQEHIFEPFFTTKEVGKGTGLGLSMVHGTVNQSGGAVFVDSEIGRGTTFRIYFPPAGEPTPASGPISASIPAARGNREPTILVVEDEDVVRALVASTLAHHGYRILRASSAEEALDLSTDAGTIDLLLTDANMPGMSGIALARLFLAARPDLPVIVMSGYSEEMLETSTLPPHAGVLQKPFTPNDLRQRIREILGTSP